ncbi:trypsin-like serine peptidase [Geodermatophilus sp. SYSU D01105]
MVAIGVHDRLLAIRERWEASEEQRNAAREAVDRRDLGLVNSPADLDERRERLRRRHLRLEGIVDQDDSVWLSFFDCGLRAARSVGRVVEAPVRRPVRPVGTGSLVTDRLLLTNHHVIRTPEEAAGMAVEFAYEYDEDGRPRAEDRWPLAPDDCFVTDPDLDYTVVAVVERDGRPPGATYGSIPLIGQTGKAVIGEVLNVIHHPAGERKRVSLRFNRMVAEDDLWLRYESDTREGSSGAPVFNDQWEMVALHHGGISATDDEGFELTRDGRRWTEDLGEDALAYVGNEGARVSRIVRSLRAVDVPPGQAALLAPILGGGQ